MILFIFYLSFLLQFTNGLQRNYNFFMPDLPSSRSPLISTISTTRKIYPLTTRSFTKINLSGGPFNVKFYQNLNSNDNYTSVDVEAEESLQKYVLIDVIQNNLLSIRMSENFKMINKTNITLTITYRQLNELHIDGTINVQCLNQIQTNSFRFFNLGTGDIKLKLNVDTLDAHLHSVGRIKLCGHVHDEVTLKSLGVGDVQCRNLLTKKINVLSSGIGNIYVMAIEEINITLSGIGTVYYTGPLNHQTKTGLGNIVEIPNVIPSIDEQITNEDLN